MYLFILCILFILCMKTFNPTSPETLQSMFIGVSVILNKIVAYINRCNSKSTIYEQIGSQPSMRV